MFFTFDPTSTVSPMLRPVIVKIIKKKLHYFFGYLSCLKRRDDHKFCIQISFEFQQLQKMYDSFKKSTAIITSGKKI